MSELVVDLGMQNVLIQVTNMIEIRDANGNLLGHFIPNRSDTSAESQQPQISLEEMQRRIQAGGGRPLKAILADLEKHK